MQSRTTALTTMATLALLSWASTVAGDEMWVEPEEPVAPAVGACDAYSACIAGMADAFEKADFPGAEDAAKALRDSREALVGIEGSAAESGCRAALEAMAKAEDAYDSMPDFTFPEECRAGAVARPRPEEMKEMPEPFPPPAAKPLRVEVRALRLMPSWPYDEPWDGWGPISPALSEMIYRVEDRDATFAELEALTARTLSPAALPDPFVEVLVNDVVRARTVAARDRLSVRWRGSAAVRLDRPDEDYLSFRVWDSDLFFDDFIGVCDSGGYVPPDVIGGTWTLTCSGSIYEIELAVREAARVDSSKVPGD